jgi:hypothetical protein
MGDFGENVGEFLFGKDPTTEQVIIDPNDISQVNPFFEQQFGNLQNLQNQFLGGLTGPPQVGNINISQFDPTTTIGQLQGVTPAIQDIASQMISPFGTQGQATADLLSREAVRNVASEFGGMGSLRSGAALSAMTRGAALPQAQLLQQIAGMQSQLGGGLAGSFLGGAFQGGLQGQSLQTQADLQRQQLQMQAGLQNQQMNANLLNSILAQQTGLAGSEFILPTIVTHPGTSGNLGGLLTVLGGSMLGDTFSGGDFFGGNTGGGGGSPGNQSGGISADIVAGLA